MKIPGMFLMTILLFSGGVFMLQAVEEESQQVASESVTPEQADEMFEKKEYEKAILLYEELTKKDPTEEYYFYRLGIAHYRSKNFKKAIESLEEARLLDPFDRGIQMSLAYAYLQDQQYEKSQREFQEILTNVPESNEAKEGMKLLKERWKSESFAAEKKEEGESDAEKIESFAADKKEKGEPDAKKPEWVICLEEKAEIFKKREDYCKAISVYRMLLCAFPEEGQYYYELGRLYIRVELKARGMRYLHSAVALKPDNEDFRSILAYEYLYDHDLTASQRLFQITLAHDPEHADALAGMGQIFEERGCDATAEAYYLAALASNPDNVKGLIYLSRFRSKQRRFREAEWLWCHVLEVEPRDEELRWAWWNVKKRTHPHVLLGWSFNQEREKEEVFVDGVLQNEEVAILDYHAGSIEYIWQPCDRLELSTGYRHVWYKQRNPLRDFTVFSAEWDQLDAAALWYKNQWVSFQPSLSIQNSRNSGHDVNLVTDQKTLFLPGFVTRIDTDYNTLTLSAISDTVFARYFDEDEARMIWIAGGAIRFNHQTQGTRYYGADASYFYYSGRNPNRHQIYRFWLHQGIWPFENNLAIRYEYEWKAFDKVLSEYYTYKRNSTHWINIDFLKPLPCDYFVSAAYWHGWKTVIDEGEEIPTGSPTLPDSQKRRKEINKVYLSGGKRMCQRTELKASGSYYRDTDEYVIWSAKVLLTHIF